MLSIRRCCSYSEQAILFHSNSSNESVLSHVSSQLLVNILMNDIDNQLPIIWQFWQSVSLSVPLSVILSYCVDFAARSRAA